MPQDSGSAVLALIGGLFLFIFVLAMAYLCTRWIGKHYGASFRSGGKIKVLDQKLLGQDRALYIVQIGKKVWLLGASGNSIVSLGEFESEEFLEFSESEVGEMREPKQDTIEFISTFKESLQRYSTKKK